MSKQIDEMAEALLEAVNEKHGHISMRGLAKALYNAGFRKQNEWIPVAERLPEDNTRVLGFSERDKDIYCYDVDGVKWWTEDYWNTAEGYGITHWMPLPEPPETEKGGAE